MPKKAKGKASSRKDRTDAKSENPSKQSGADKPKPKKKQKSKEMNEVEPLSNNHSYENGTKEEKSDVNGNEETDIKKTDEDEESQPDPSSEVPEEENHDGSSAKLSSSTSSPAQPTETSASGPKDLTSESSRPVVDVKSSAQPQPAVSRDRLRETEVEEEQQSEEEKKAASDSPQSEGEEEGDEEESDQEIKQIEPQQIDFGTGKSPATSQDDRFAFYIPFRKRVSSFVASKIPQLPQLPSLSQVTSHLPSYESIASIPSIVHSVQTTFPSTEKVYTTVSEEVTYFRSKVVSTFNQVRTYASNATSGGQHSVPPWISQMVVHLKFLFLALFYVHFLVWILISLLLISINVFTLLLGPWAVFPIGGWGIGLYLHLIATSYILTASGAKANELSWLESLISRTGLQIKGFTNTAYEVASHKYQHLCQSWCQGNRA